MTDAYGLIDEAHALFADLRAAHTLQMVGDKAMRQEAARGDEVLPKVLSDRYGVDLVEPN